MAIASSLSKSGPYLCNGATTAFAFAFATLATTDVTVVRTDANGVDTQLALGPDFTVTINADQTASPGGSVTLSSVPASGYQITILRNIALTQGTSLPNQGGWYPKVVESALDKLTMGLQQLAEQVGRAVKIGVATTQTPDQMIAAIAANAAAAAGSATAASGSATAAAGSASAAAISAAQAASAAGGHGTLITGNINLTASNVGALTINPSGPGQYMTLPDATTCVVGAALFSGQNISDYDYGVKNAAGTVVGWIGAGKGATIGLSDNTVVAGAWVASGLQKVAVTALLSAPTISSNDNNLIVLPVDSNRTLVLFGNLYAAMYDASTLTWTNPVLVRSGALICSVALSGANQALVISANGTAGEAVTISLGASLTVNTANKATFTVPGTVQNIGPITQVATSWVFSARDSTPATYVAAVTVSGNTPTVGSLTTVAASFNSDPVIIAAGTVARVFGLDASSLYAKPYTVSGTTLTPGTSASDSTGGGFDNQFRAMQLGSGNVLVQYSAVSPVKAAIIKLTGTTESISAITLSGLTGGTNTVNDLLPISSTKALVAVGDTSAAVAYANIITDTSGVASAGTPYISPTSGVNNCAALQVVGTTARVAYYTGSEAIEAVFDCSGVSPSVVSRHIGNQQIAMPTKSDRYGRRHYANLLAGSAVQVLANGAKADGRYTAGGIQIAPTLPINLSSGAPGASPSESWGLDRSQAVGGKVVKRIEACA